MSTVSAAELMPLDVSYRELMAQPRALEMTLQEQSEGIAAIARLLGDRTINRLYLVGCGDSHYASWSAKFAVESLCGLPCEVAQAFEYAHYVWEATDARTLVIGLSSSGRSHATVMAMRQARQRGAMTVAVTNTPDSPITQEVDASILVRATRDGWPTQASTAALGCLYLLAVEIAQTTRGADSPGVLTVRRQLAQLPALMAGTLADVEAGTRQLAEHLADQRNFLYVGGGPNFGTVQFGMAKLKEASQEHSVVLELEEYSHIQSFALGAREPVFLIAPPGRSYARALEIAAAVTRGNGQLIALIDQLDTTMAMRATHTFRLPTIDERLSPMVYVLPLQLFAHYLATRRVQDGYKRPLRADYES